MKRHTLLIITLLFCHLLVQGQISLYNLSEGRRGIVIAEFGNNIHFIGGGDTNVIDIYDPINNSLTSTNYPNTDEFDAAQFYQNETEGLFVRLLNVNLVNINYMSYSYPTNSWIFDRHNGVIPYDFEFQYIDEDKVYFDNQDSNRIHYFDFNTRSWSSKSRPFDQEDYTVIQDGNLVYFVGGTRNGVRIQDIAIYDLDTNTWSFTAFESPARRAPALGIINGKLVINGGWNAYLKEVEIFDPATNTSAIATLQSARFDAQVITASDKIVLYEERSDRIDIIDVNTLSVEKITIPDIGSRTMKAVNLNDIIYFASTDSPYIHMYHPDLNMWKTFPIAGVRAYVSMKLIDNRIYIAGGEDANGNDIDELIVIENWIDSDGDGFNCFVDCDDTNSNIGEVGSSCIIPGAVNATVQSDCTCVGCTSVANNVFTGNSLDNYWHNPENWSLNMIPDECQHVIIPENMNVTLLSGEIGECLTIDVKLTANFCLDLGAQINVLSIN